ncbi:MAG TPA: cytochrome P450 [Polyangiales bacterium]|nr:cytochrome P450 [Polyangiales bacterium]
MPSTRSIPYQPGRLLVGHLFEARNRRIPLLVELAREHPDVVRIRVGLSNIVALNSPALIHQLLVEHHAAVRPNYMLQLFAEPLLGQGLLRLERAAHLKRRRTIAPAFMPRRIQHYAQEMIDRAERAAQRMHGRGEVDIVSECMRVTFSIAGKTLFGAEVESEVDRVGRALREVIDRISRCMTQLVPVPAMLPTLGNLGLRRAVRRLDRLVYQMLAERRASSEDRGDLLQILLETRDAEDGSALTDRQIRDEAMTQYLAGHETTANTLAWALCFLGRAPAARARLEAEVDAVTGGRPLQPSDLPKLTWTLQVIKETLRLCPAVYCFARMLERPVNIGPYPLSKRDVVVVNIIGMHRRPDLYADPDRFAPERFDPERERALPAHAFIPFSLGPRNCMGSHFALMEAQLVLATWLRRLRFDSLSTALPDFEALFTLRPKGAVRMRVSERSPARVERAAP